MASVKIVSVETSAIEECVCWRQRRKRRCSFGGLLRSKWVSNEWQCGRRRRWRSSEWRLLVRISEHFVPLFWFRVRVTISVELNSLDRYFWWFVLKNQWMESGYCQWLIVRERMWDDSWKGSELKKSYMNRRDKEILTAVYEQVRRARDWDYIASILWFWKEERETAVHASLFQNISHQTSEKRL